MAFTTPEELFELTVTFFRLINSPATFQATMNKLLRDLINIRKIRSFTNNVIVGTENKKEYDKLVKKILRRIKENNLYIKLEKCK